MKGALGSERHRILGAARLGSYRAPPPRAFQSRRRTHSTSYPYLGKKQASIKATSKQNSVCKEFVDVFPVQQILYILNSACLLLFNTGLLEYLFLMACLIRVKRELYLACTNFLQIRLIPLSFRYSLFVGIRLIPLSLRCFLLLTM